MNIGVWGAGYVGLVTGACLGSLGHDVVFYDCDSDKIEALERGRVSFFEPGLSELLEDHRERIDFTTEPAKAARGQDVIFIAVGTPSAQDGRADLAGVYAAARSIAEAVDGPALIVNKSTVPVQTADDVERIVRKHCAHRGCRVVSNPEFLREGCAIEDFMHPDRIVLGCDDPWAEKALRDLYAPLDAPIVVTDRRSAELIKYAANAFLATKISYVNEIAGICERAGANIEAVVHGIGLDSRIGPTYLEPGLGFGGSCLPKDVRALQATANRVAIESPLLDAVLRVNDLQVERVAARLAYVLGGLKGHRVGVLGLTFKPGTSDLRESPALTLLQLLSFGGCEVHAHDPVAASAAESLCAERGATVHDDVERCLSGADALILATAWPHYRALDPAAVGKLMRRRIAFDVRNALDADAYTRAGFLYNGVGAPARPYPLELREGA